MSRLIIKNLPNKVTPDQIRNLFGQKGEVTDVQLKYTKDGKFRNFGFVGYRTEEQASSAIEYFDGTCINSMKIQVEPCANLGDEKKPRAWSKYATDSTAYKNIHKDELQEKAALEKKEKKVQKNKNKIHELLRKHKDDPMFAEFIEAHVNDKTAWIKDAFMKAANSDDDDSGVENENEEIIDKQDDQKDEQKKEEVKKTNDKKEEKIKTVKGKEKIANKQISDLEYMKLLMKKVDKTSVQTTEQATEATEETENQEEEPKIKKVRNRQLFTIKITGLPFKCKKKDIKEFFRPLVPYSIRLPLGKGKKLTGFCYVGFRTEKELKKALNKDKLFLGTHRIHIHKYEDKASQAQEEEENNNKKRQEKSNNEESIGESGSIFVRNLPYVVSEAELTALFEKYGPIADVSMPIDPVLRQPKGFATVTFVMPEHAVKAFTELDGTAFCGRMMHLLPAKTEKLENDDDDDVGLSFKEKKAKKLKAQAKSSHNWNVLFLGANAVADVIAANFNTTKEQLLADNNKNTSAAVRLALGETQLVAETKAFLESNGVYLEAFNKPSKKRSKTCILVKNLPSNTEKDEIRALFEKHGMLARCLMPKHGITALIDFVEPFEAKKAFNKLAYSQFKHMPLYLEWAPENVFIKSIDNSKSKNDEASSSEDQEPKEVSSSNKNSKPVKMEEDNSSNSKVDKDRTGSSSNEKDQTGSSSKMDEDIKEDSSDAEEPENDTTLFVKNLNFRTTDEVLKSHFAKCGKVYSATIAKKKDPKNPGQLLSMGYGFVQYVRKESANEALKILQTTTLDGKTLELKRSERGNSNQEVKTAKKTTKETKQNGTKILVRNVPFQANRNELHEIFRAFGEIKTLRLPKKLSPGSDQHRGFAFVDYYSKADSKSAFDALCQSTHLYGRRLVLEWADHSEDNEDVSELRKRTADRFNAKSTAGKKSKKGAVDVDQFVGEDTLKD